MFTSVPNSFVSDVTASASEVNANFDAIVNGLSDGTKDIGVLAGTFTGAIDANSTLQVAGAFTASSTARFAGAATFSGAVYAGSTLQCTGAATFSAAVYAGGTLQCTGAATFSGAVYAASTLQCTGNATFSGNVYNAGTLQNTGAATFSGAVYALSTLNCTGNATFSAEVGELVDYSDSTVVSGLTGTVSKKLKIRKIGKSRVAYFRMYGSSISNILRFTLGENVASMSAGWPYFTNPVPAGNGTDRTGLVVVSQGVSTVFAYPSDDWGITSWISNTIAILQGSLNYEVD